jgi:hypothetical protein
MLLLTIVLVVLFGAGAFYGYHKSARSDPRVIWFGSFQDAGSD